VEAARRVLHLYPDAREALAKAVAIAPASLELFLAIAFLAST
jgi:hypothetical protein